MEETHPTVAPRWPTRVFASESVQKIMRVCEQQRAHFDLALARELKKDTGKGITRFIRESITRRWVRGNLYPRGPKLKMLWLQSDKS